MKLQILVPHYKEKAFEMEPLLDSLALQQNIDFSEIGVIIAYDGDEASPLPEADWKMKYPFQIRHVHAEHNGVSATRNFALDHATADYVMFCDADDMFCNVCGLFIVFQEMERGFETFVSAFIEETRDQNRNPIYVNHNMDSTFVHGKVHRRKYLINNNIRFNPSLTIHEDSYFNVLAQSLVSNQDQARFCPTPFYLWKWRDNSVCRHDKDYILKTYTNMLDSNDALVNQFIDRNRIDKAKFYASAMILDSYYTMNKKEWLDKTNAEYREKVEKRFDAYYKSHKNLWDSLTEEEKVSLSSQIRNRYVTEGMPMETITLNQWLSKFDN